MQQQNWQYQQFLQVRLTNNKKDLSRLMRHTEKKGGVVPSYRAGDGFTSLFWPPLVHSFERSHRVLGHHRIGFFQSKEAKSWDFLIRFLVFHIGSLGQSSFTILWKSRFNQPFQQTLVQIFERSHSHHRMSFFQSKQAWS